MYRKFNQYLQDFYQDLRNLEKLVRGSKSIQSNVDDLADFISRYIVVSKFALVRTDAAGKLLEEACWSSYDSIFPKEDFDRLMREGIPSLIEAYQSGSEADLNSLFRSQTSNDLDCYPLAYPILYEESLLGFAFYCKPLRAGDWAEWERNVLQMFTSIIGLSFSDINQIEKDQVQSWILTEVMDCMKANLYITDVETDEILYMNQTMKQAFGAENPEGKKCWEVLQKELKGRCAFCPVKELLESGEARPSCVWEETNSVTGRTYENYDSLMKWTDGRIVHFQQSYDITDTKALSAAASRDDLTGILNRRAGKQALMMAAAEAKKDGVPLTVGLYDVNELKKINDHYGHAEGDFLISVIAETVKKQMGEKDFPFRLSGDEFVVVFYNCLKPEAENRFNQILSFLEQKRKNLCKPYEISFCFGMCEIRPEEEFTVSDILAQADEKMYRQKQERGKGIKIVRESELKRLESELALQNSYIEIYEWNFSMDYVALIMRNNEMLVPVAETGSTDKTFKKEMEAGIHPDDVEKCSAFYRKGELEKAFRSGEKERTIEYRRLGRDGKYYWILVTVMPITLEKDGVRVLILLKNISEQKELKTEQDKLEKRFNMVFRQAIDLMTEVDLATGRFSTRIFSERFRETYIPEGEYGEYLNIALQKNILEEDRENVIKSFSLDALKKAMVSGCKEVSCQFRVQKGLLKGEPVYWLENRAFFMRDGSGIAVIISRDITEQKKREMQEHIAEQYDTALRNIYDELFELNLSQNSYKIVYHTAGKYVIPPEEGVLEEAVYDVSEHMIHPDDKKRFLDFFDIKKMRESFACGKESLLGEFRKLWTDGKYHWSSITVFPVKRFDRGDEIYLCFIMDLVDQKRADEIEKQNQILRQQQLDDERYRIILEQTDTIVFEWSREKREFYFPDKMKELFTGNYNHRQLKDNWEEDRVIHPKDRSKLHEFIERIQMGRSYAEMLVRLKTKKGHYIWCQVAVTIVKSMDGGLERLIGTINDADEATKAARDLRYRAEYDLLTGIYNVQTFFEKTEELLKKHPERKLAVIRMDVNRFKFINDLYGIEEGDKLLRFIAQIIKLNVGENDIYCRVSGDIFSMCVQYQTEDDLTELTKTLTKRLAEYSLGYKAVPYFGICIISDRRIPVRILCDWANMAQKTVKGNMISNTAFYDDKLRAKQLDERQIEESMERALEEEQFTIYLQPKYDIRTSKIVGAEALARWLHPTEGMIMPDRFIPLFERNGFIIRLDEYIWEQVCKTLRRWIDLGYTPLPVSMNVSRLHIFNPDFCKTMKSLAEQYRLPKELIELELTETTFIENPEELYKAMTGLQKEGFQFSMDDFGAGYSSLNMLKNTKVNTIKLDKGFISDVASVPAGKTVVHCTIEMAKQLNLEVVSEGVETKEQADFLLEAGCNIAQGYYFSKPVPVKEFEKLAFEGA